MAASLEAGRRPRAAALAALMLALATACCGADSHVEAVCRAAAEGLEGRDGVEMAMLCRARLHEDVCKRAWSALGPRPWTKESIMSSCSQWHARGLSEATSTDKTAAKKQQNLLDAEDKQRAFDDSVKQKKTDAQSNVTAVEKSTCAKNGFAYSAEAAAAGRDPCVLPTRSPTAPPTPAPPTAPPTSAPATTETATSTTTNTPIRASVVATGATIQVDDPAAFASSADARDALASTYAELAQVDEDQVDVTITAERRLRSGRRLATGTVTVQCRITVPSSSEEPDAASDVETSLGEVDAEKLQSAAGEQLDKRGLDDNISVTSVEAPTVEELTLTATTTTAAAGSTAAAGTTTVESGGETTLDSIDSEGGDSMKMLPPSNGEAVDGNATKLAPNIKSPPSRENASTSESSPGASPGGVDRSFPSLENSTNSTSGLSPEPNESTPSADNATNSSSNSTNSSSPSSSTDPASSGPTSEEAEPTPAPTESTPAPTESTPEPTESTRDATPAPTSDPAPGTTSDPASAPAGSTPEPTEPTPEPTESTPEPTGPAPGSTPEPTDPEPTETTSEASSDSDSDDSESDAIFGKKLRDEAVEASNSSTNATNATNSSAASQGGDGAGGNATRLYSDDSFLRPTAPAAGASAALLVAAGALALLSSVASVGRWRAGRGGNDSRIAYITLSQVDEDDEPLAESRHAERLLGPLE